MEDTTWKHFYGMVQKLSLFTGMWPYLKPRERILRSILLTIIILTIVVPQIAHHFTCNKDLQCLFESMTSSLLTTVTMVKVCAFQLNIHKIRIFTDHLLVDWQQLETPEECEIMKLYAENCRRFSLIYPVYCLTAVYIFMSVSIVPHIFDIVWPLNESRPILLPYPGYYFVDSRTYFYYIYSHSLVGWEIVMIALVAHDCMFVSYIEHICSMLAIIGSRFECLFCKHGAVGDTTKDSDDVHRRKVALFAHSHRKTLEFAQLLEKTFTIPFAIQLLIIIITMSCSMLQLTQDSSILELLRYIFYIIGQLFHLFCLSFEGQKLIDHSLQIRDKIYNSTWYEAPVKSQKLLLLVMIQCFRPTSLSAGKIYIFSLESFTTVLQTSMSYFTVLTSFQ